MSLNLLQNDLRLVHVLTESTVISCLLVIFTQNSCAVSTKRFGGVFDKRKSNSANVENAK